MVRRCSAGKVRDLRSAGEYDVSSLVNLAHGARYLPFGGANGTTAPPVHVRPFTVDVHDRLRGLRPAAAIRDRRVRDTDVAKRGSVAL